MQSLCSFTSLALHYAERFVLGILAQTAITWLDGVCPSEIRCSFFWRDEVLEDELGEGEAHFVNRLLKCLALLLIFFAFLFCACPFLPLPVALTLSRTC